MANLALDCCLAQAYRPLEIIIGDDDDERAFAESPTRDTMGVSLSYLRLPKMQIAEKRNYLCERAQGEIIAHFDSDDWSDPHRLTDQVERLDASKKSVTGYSSMLFFDESTAECFRYSGVSDYALGTSLCYRKAFWCRTPFVDGRLYEDFDFWQRARMANEVASIPAAAEMVARIHAGNTAPKRPKQNRTNWKQVGMGDLPGAFMTALRKEACCAV